MHRDSLTKIFLFFYPKKRKSLTVFLVISACLIPQFAGSQNYDNQAKKIDSEIKRIEKEQAKQRKDRAKINAQLKTTNKKLKKINKNLNNLDFDIKNQEQLVLQLKNKTEKNRSLQTNAKDALAALMSEHAKTQTPNLLLFLLVQQDVNSLDRQQVYFKYFSRARQQQINVLRIDYQDAESTALEYTQRQKALEKKYRDQEKLKKDISATNSQKTKLLKKLDSNIAENTSTIKKLKVDRKRLTALIDRLQKQRAAQSQKEFIPAKGGFSKQQGRMLAPINGRVTTGFGQKKFSTNLRSNGLIFKANKSGTNSVHAIYDGRVIFSSWLKGFGNLIILEHGGGYMSLYGNNQTLNKKEGDVVSARETIAVYQQGLKNHFYFEIRKKGKAINPKPWLKK